MEKGRKEGLSREQMQQLLQSDKKELHTAVTQQDFVLALSKVNKSVSDQDLQKFEDWMKEFGSA